MSDDGTSAQPNWPEICMAIWADSARPMAYDRTGKPISIEQWAELLDNAAYRVAHDTVGEAMVSTVWIGINMGFGHDKPQIFETMIFGGKYDQYLRRYPTETDAIQGHAEAVEDLRIGMEPWWQIGGCDDDEWTSG